MRCVLITILLYYIEAIDWFSPSLYLSQVAILCGHHELAHEIGQFQSSQIGEESNVHGKRV